jgi:hypothetical protein
MTRPKTVITYSIPCTFVEEAPIDAVKYVRKNGNWIDINDNNIVYTGQFYSAGEYQVTFLDSVRHAVPQYPLAEDSYLPIRYNERFKTLLYDPFTNIPISGITISNCVLTMHSRFMSIQETTVTGYVHRIRTPWDLSTVCWDYAYGSTPWETAGASGTSDCEIESVGSFVMNIGDSYDTEYLVNIDASKVQEMVDGTIDNWGFLLEAAGNGTVVSVRPTITVTYTINPIGASGSFVSQDSKTVTVVSGIIVSIV